MFNRLGELGDGLFGVAVLDTCPDAVVQMPFQYYLANLMQGAFDRVHLDQHVFAGNVLFDHFIDRFHLPHYFVEPSMQIRRIHALAHRPILASKGASANPLEDWTRRKA